jgi:hypothetical protein
MTFLCLDFDFVAALNLWSWEDWCARYFPFTELEYIHHLAMKVARSLETCNSIAIAGMHCIFALCKANWTTKLTSLSTFYYLCQPESGQRYRPLHTFHWRLSSNSAWAEWNRHWGSSVRFARRFPQVDQSYRQRVAPCKWLCKLAKWRWRTPNRFRGSDCKLTPAIRHSPAARRTS